MHTFRNATGSTVVYRPTGATGKVLRQDPLSWCVLIEWATDTTWTPDSVVFPAPRPCTRCGRTVELNQLGGWFVPGLGHYGTLCPDGIHLHTVA